MARLATLTLETHALGLGCFLTISFHLLVFSNLLIVEIWASCLTFSERFLSFLIPLSLWCSVSCGSQLGPLALALDFGFLLSLSIRGLPYCPRLLLRWHLALKAESSFVLVRVLAVLECPPLMASVGTLS